MKFCILILATSLAVCLSQKYTSRYDSINIDMILSNRRVLKNYIRCVLDEGPCTAEGRELRNNIPDAVQTNCSKCTEAQRKFMRKGTNFLIKNHPDEWKKIAKKYNLRGQTPSTRNL